jgi:hypothetical protein
MKTNSISLKTARWFYWISTILLSLGMLSGGVAQLLKVKANMDGMLHLGYPSYFMVVIGVWKISGVVAILIPGFGLVKEWAYAGLFFVMSGAVISHVVTGDGIDKWITPFIFLALIIVSWKLRPQSRKLQAITNEAIS